MRNLHLTGFIALLAALGCRAPQRDHENVPDTGSVFTITHFNILFAPDMSNRVDTERYKRPLNDVNILSIVTSDLYPSILRFKRSENQKDKLRIDFINRGLINQYAVNTDKLLIDFDRFANQKERINYIRQTLKKDEDEMTMEFTRVNGLAVRQNFGADIWSYLNQGIDDKRVLFSEKPVRLDHNTYVNTYRNILIMPTDGYIEAGIFGKGVDLGQNTVARFREAFSNSGETSMQQFLDSNKQFQIRPVNNAYLKDLEILVMELYDRSLSKQGAATVHPTDMEIIKLLWTKWLQQSGVKRFELHPFASSRDEAEKTILNFMGITKTL
ncbi:MAG TPA: hypothetical protein VM802_15140 [Chitinophaga sp.]|uniref:hypothetical protein n=1 Tax=Chitinophaga sp. TaxID=1869181 RepID=UPI002C7982DC|nr:hypothetical protein [Chitinophaga sp.]HVI46209.1 hypothetical protein [Chitinophaga sp.]